MIKIAIPLVLLLSSSILTSCGTAANNQSNVSAPPPAVQPMPTLQFSASPTNVNSGAFTTLSWSTKNATSIKFDPSIAGEDQTSYPLSGSEAIAPSATTAYTATATGAGGSVSQSVTVQVSAATPVISLVATQRTITAGESTTLSWNSQGATTLTISGIGAVPVSGSQVVSPRATTSYIAQAVGPGGSASAGITITVSLISLTVSQQAVTPGDAVTLSWNAPTATSITIDNGIGSVAPPSGSISVTPQTTTRYTATALDPQGNTSTNSALVVVSSAGHGFVNIRHIIFFVQENRSFDNYFGQMGQYRAQQGYTDPFDGLPPNASQPDASGITVPSFHLGTVCVENTDPGWLSAWDDYDNGQMDHFVIEAGKLTQKYFANSPDPNGTRAMGYYDSTDLPYYYALAFQFATSDRFFSPVLTGTIPNRMYLFAGSSFGYIYPPNSTSIGQFKQPTIFDRLDQAGISWRYYYQDDTVFLSQWSTWSKDSGKVWNISHWYSDVQNEATLPQVIFIERASHLHLDEHPGGTYSNIQLGAANTQRIFSALMQSPSWPSSLLILTYDEFGGLYDHVPPAPMPAPDNIPPPSGFGGDFRHSGFRVPVIVISPWIKPHFVSHVTRDYTSILKLIETRFGVRSLTARDAAADDMTEFLDFSQPHWGQPPVLPAQPTNGTCTLQDEKAPEF